MAAGLQARRHGLSGTAIACMNRGCVRSLPIVSGRHPVTGGHLRLISRSEKDYINSRIDDARQAAMHQGKVCAQIVILLHVA